MNQDNVFGWLPCSVVFISTAHGEERDIMTATAMFVSEKEPLLLISVAKNHLTEKLITQSGKFTVVIAGEDQRQLSLQLGSLKGEGIDKFKHFSVKTMPTEAGEALIPEGAAAWLSCETESSQEITGYRLFIGRVVKQSDTGNPPLVWRKNGFFALTPV